MKQTSFFQNKSEHSSARVAHGGGVTAGKRKVYRPLDRRRPLHIMMKSSHARGELSLLGLQRKLKVDGIVRESAKDCGVTIHEFENVGNHLHFVVSFKLKAEMQRFLRVVSGLVARLVTGARRGRPFGKRFWDHLVFTRILTGRRDFQNMERYMAKNKVERESGSAMRQAMEFHEIAERLARKTRRSLVEVMEELLNEFAKEQLGFGL